LFSSFWGNETTERRIILTLILARQIIRMLHGSEKLIARVIYDGKQ
jgi:hypothetical protein